MNPQRLPAIRIAALLLAAAGLAGCTSVAHVPPPPAAPAVANIPPGHLPPPGLCRIWYPGRPPGHQPPPGPCPTLWAQLPPGAVLVYGR